MHRHQFVPTIPTSIEQAGEVPVTLHEEQYPIAEGLETLFPTLLGKAGMKYFELRQDAKNGALAKSERPLRVS